jgi:hypothetical protein
MTGDINDSFELPHQKRSGNKKPAVSSKKPFIRNAWENRWKILGALRNRISSLIFPFLNRRLNAEARRRKKICSTCIFNSSNYGRIDPSHSNTQLLPYCTLCSCIIDLKVYCMSCNCGIEVLNESSETPNAPLKWEALSNN